MFCNKFHRTLLFAITLCSTSLLARAQSTMKDAEPLEHANARFAYVNRTRMSDAMSGCTPNAIGPGRDVLKLVCDDEGYAKVRLLYKEGENWSKIQDLQKLGFLAVQITTRNIAVVSGAPDLFFLVTPAGLQKPREDNIPVDATLNGRYRFVFLAYGDSVANHGCQADIAGKSHDILYYSCPQMKSDWRDGILSPAGAGFAKILSDWGFTLAILGNETTSFVPALVTPAGFSVLPPIGSRKLLAEYGISSARF